MFSKEQVANLVGKPYCDMGGDGVNSFDCASLVRYVTGIDPHIIPSCKIGDTKAVMKIIAENKKHFKIIDKPKENCIVALCQKRLPHHVGVYLYGGVLHATLDGVAWSTLKELEQNGYTWEFGEFIEDNK